MILKPFKNSVVLLEENCVSKFWIDESQRELNSIKSYVINETKLLFNLEIGDMEITTTSYSGAEWWMK
jgi:hypothetical protein